MTFILREIETSAQLGCDIVLIDDGWQQGITANSTIVSVVVWTGQFRHYEDVSLENVAEEMFVSAEHLGCLFKKQTGENLLQYVTKMKMEKAAARI